MTEINDIRCSICGELLTPQQYKAGEIYCCVECEEENTEKE